MSASSGDKWELLYSGDMLARLRAGELSEHELSELADFEELGAEGALESALEALLPDNLCAEESVRGEVA